ncbi:MAG TPA: hypothetical protein V6D17_14410 [Candidatus Obscuribacterales bacterium]
MGRTEAEAKREEVALSALEGGEVEADSPVPLIDQVLAQYQIEKSGRIAPVAAAGESGAGQPQGQAEAEVAPAGAKTDAETDAKTFHKATDKPAVKPIDNATDKTTDTPGESFKNAKEEGAADELKVVDYGQGERYVGDFSIRRDVRPSRYVSSGGESVRDIARKHLGPGATEEDVKKHAQEIAIVNMAVAGMSDEYVAKKGDFINLPGHTKDGAIVYRDYRGTTVSVTEDGAVTFKHTDGTGHVLKGNEGGGYTKKYFGPKPEDNYTVRINEKGVAESNDRVDPNHRKAADLNSERERLDAIADKTVLLTKERRAMRQDMEAFEKRARQSGLSDKEVAQFYAEVSRILELKGNKPMTDRERVRLALGTIRGAAEPTSNDQGDYATCQTSVVENRLYNKEPSAVARALADVATTGKFVAADGTVVKLEANDLRAHGQAALNAERGTWVRTYASQIYQVTAINALHTRNNELKIPPGGMRWVQGRQNGDDNGERLMDFSKIPPKLVSRLPDDAGYPDGVAEMQYLMSGRWEPETVLSSVTYARMTDGRAQKTNVIDTKENLQAQLEKLHAEKKYPLPLVVHANSDPILATRKPQYVPLNGKADANRYLSDVHILNVLDYNPKTGEIKLDNQWSNKGDFIDKPLTVDQLWGAMNRPTAMQWLDRLDAKRPGMSPDEYAAHLKAIMQASIYHWAVEKEAAGLPYDQDDMRKSLERFNRTVSRLDPKYGQPAKSAVDEMLAAWEKDKADQKAQEEELRRQQDQLKAQNPTTPNPN